ncbi:EamA family transporter RarD [Paenibacillus sp. SC116]|uniref:EamA family transporter RarD n=1 Tax=Paenibacillus sp. SC116 TaxID=2968986 RepID=UPI00215A3CAB|nr:EamA family transporter RarD [Paenibacillus sp. SC116]MCR8844299.1 EamA family transporter RarD [Paenibacillus sp. SC116]
METKHNPYAVGVLAAVVSYILWGVLPIYWKAIGSVPAGEVLAHRIIWSLLFMIVVLLLLGKLKIVIEEIKQVFTDKKMAIRIILAAVVISVNWLVYIFAVESDRVIEASLGYYMNPLFNIFLATIFLKERLKKLEWLSVAIAGVGVLGLVLYYGYFPWAALILAATFSFYGLMKKTVPISAWAGLTIETLIMVPIALVFLFGFESSPSFWDRDVTTIFLLIGAGAVTAVPLLLFAAGTKRISFTLVGFLQYIAPTIMLGLGLFLFNEPFSTPQLLAFMMIWLALLLFTYSRSKELLLRRKQEPQLAVHKK